MTTIYYSVFAVFQGFGYVASTNSLYALIPSLAHTKSSKITLNSLKTHLETYRINLRPI